MNSNEPIELEPDKLRKIKEFLHAAKTGNLIIVDSLLKQKMFVDATDPSDPLRNTALHLAAENDHLNIVLKLLDKGADIEKKRQDKHARTPLHLAAAQGHSKVIRTLLEHGADIDKVGSAGMTALYRAATKNHVEVVRTLLLYGADIYKTDKLLDMTALQSAILRKNLEVVKLLTIYASFNSYIPNEYIDSLTQRIKEEYVKNQTDLSLKKLSLNKYLTQIINREALSLWENKKSKIEENLQNSLANREDIGAYSKEAKAFFLECLRFRASKKCFRSKINDNKEI